MTTQHHSEPPSLRPRYRPAIAVLVATFWLLTSGALTASAATPYPRSMASTGDSITRAYNTGFFPYLDDPSASWSTGTNGSVASHYTRLVARQPAISGHAFNDAKSGAKMVDLAGQLATAATQRVDYVTVLIGGNDICTSSESSMTSVGAFQSQFVSAMNTIASSSPSTRVYVVSIPNVYNLWSVLKDSFTARTVWSLFGVCQSMLANPLSTSQADIDRRLECSSGRSISTPCCSWSVRNMRAVDTTAAPCSAPPSVHRISPLEMISTHRSRGRRSSPP